MEGFRVNLFDRILAENRPERSDIAWRMAGREVLDLKGDQTSRVKNLH